MITVPNCGHNVVAYLNKQKLLGKVLEAALEPDGMATRIRELVGTIAASEKAVRRRAARKEKRREARRAARRARHYSSRRLR
jgi:SOS-response transcriptional repressor LexA